MIIHGAPLRRLVGEIFTAAGCSEDEARRIARYLVEANLAGHDSHGVIRVPRYLRRMKTGNLIANQDIDVLADGGATVLIDGRFGFGQTLGEQAVDLGIDKARQYGVAIIALRNAGHLGRIGDWAERAAAAGQISIHFVNTPGAGMLVAPFGSMERRMSTNPVAIGVPRSGGDPLILDFATSTVAEGKIMVAADGGKPLPADALIDGDGAPSADPEVIYGPLGSARPSDKRDGPGAIRAMGAHKGSGLAIMCELLAGALTGSGCGRADDPRPGNGMLSIFMDIARFDTADAFAGEMARYVDFVKSARPIAPDGEVLLPGEPERRSRARREAEGIPLQDSTWAGMVEAAGPLGLSRERIDQLIA